MNLTWLEDFLALASTGNFSRAAEQRHSSQPAFSRRIRALEEWIGHDLVDRSSQPARLTEVGEWFRTVAADLLARADRLPAEAAAVAESSAGTLRIASTHALSFTFLPGWLRGFDGRVELGPLQLVSDVLQRCEALMAQGKVQFVLAHAHADVPGPLDVDVYEALRVGEDTLVPVKAPGAPFSLDAEGRGALPVLQYSDESGLGRITRAVLGPGLAPVALKPVLTAHLASVLRTMVLQGAGLAWLPQSLIAEDFAAGRLVEAGGAKWRVPLEIRLYRERGSAARAAEAFWDAAH
ncbi:LysR substrate-binding domain-containing protein [Ramlibacter algicola]|uniref:LysR family transcriptional regulator n=1 Tax=Ramlibacter algicola TaxID=2795217 RepID=A0A934UT53_9BURK|nr:LysR family transcriptional regulator [Ramlibacter algicola]